MHMDSITSKECLKILVLILIAHLRVKITSRSMLCLNAPWRIRLSMIPRHKATSSPFLTPQLSSSHSSISLLRLLLHIPSSSLNSPSMVAAVATSLHSSKSSSSSSHSMARAVVCHTSRQRPPRSGTPHSPSSKWVSQARCLSTQRRCLCRLKCILRHLTCPLSSLKFQLRHFTSSSSSNILLV